MKICKDDPTLENKLRVIMLEIEVMRQDGRKAPEDENIKQHHWEHILSLPSRSARFKYLTFLWKNEKKTENTKVKLCLIIIFRKFYCLEIVLKYHSEQQQTSIMGLQLDW